MIDLQVGDRVLFDFPGSETTKKKWYGTVEKIADEVVHVRRDDDRKLVLVPFHVQWLKKVGGYERDSQAY